MKRQQLHVMNDVTDIKCVAMTTPILACSGMKKISVSEMMSFCCLYIHRSVTFLICMSNRGCVGCGAGGGWAWCTGTPPRYTGCLTRKSFKGRAQLMPAFEVKQQAFCVAACSHRDDCTAYEYSRDQQCILRTGSQSAATTNDNVLRTCKRQGVICK